MHFIQRFGSTLNLHLHVHAVVSDGLFRRQAGLLGRPSFIRREQCSSPPAPQGQLGKTL
ncbi:MAG: transposase [Elusimicrobia bacterium]|nr:transposase [Elusimicrobiota bacterium]